MSNSLFPHRIALEVEYDGSRYAGWQKQSAPELETVQSKLEASLASVANHPVNLVCAGRTDRGVHATGQVVHFDCQHDRGEKAWVMGVNSLLPESIRVKWAATVSDKFHARFSALARRYLYLIYDAPVAPAILSAQLTHCRFPLDIDKMHNAAQVLLGEHDFTAFQASGCQSRSPYRFVEWVNVRRRNRYVIVDIQANAFLQHMVRNITGSLLEIGQGRHNVEWMAEVLAGRDRRAGGKTASARGLYLVQVNYPSQLQFPASPMGPSFLQPYP